MDVPVSAPTIVPNASASSARLARGSFPSLQEPAFFAHSDERPHVVEQIDEEKDEHQLAQPELRRRAQIELEECPGRMRPRENMRGQMADSQRYPRDRDRDDADQNRAADAPRHQDGNQKNAHRSQNHLRVGHLPQADERGRVRHDDVRVPESHERDEKPDARRRAVLQAVGNAVDDLLAHIRQREDQETAARKAAPLPAPSATARRGRSRSNT